MPTIIATQSFDAGSDGDLVNAGSITTPWVWGTGSGGTVPQIKTAAAVHGAHGLRITDLSVFQQLRHNDGTARNVVCYSEYFTIRTMPSVAVYLGSCSDAAPLKIADWRLNANGTVSARNGVQAIGTSSTALVVGTTYRAEWAISGATQTLTIYAGESTTPLFTIPGATNGNDPLQALFGVVAAAGTGAIDIDTARVSDVAPGPFGTPLAVYNKVFNKVSGTWSVHHTINRL
jgi:hypothetical protein